MSKYFVKIDPIEAAERVAWMLKGEHLGDGKVSVPEHNANDDALNTVTAMNHATWQDMGEDSESDESPQWHSAYVSLTELNERIQELGFRSEEIPLLSFRELFEQLHSAPSNQPQLQESSPAQQRFDSYCERDLHCLNNEDLVGIDASNRTLKGFNFDNSDLRGANFDNARLSGCSFIGTNLKPASKMLRCLEQFFPALGYPKLTLMVPIFVQQNWIGPICKRHCSVTPICATPVLKVQT